MARSTTLGISIQRTPFSETSQIVHFLTKDWGRIVCIAKGAFRDKNSYQGNIDLLSLNRITVSKRKGGSMALLSQRNLMNHFPGIRSNMKRFACAALMGELLRKGIQEGQKIPGVFQLALSVLDALDRGEVSADLILISLQAALLKMLGYEPVLDRCVECQSIPAPGNILTAFPGRGGVICQRCRDGETARITLSYETSRLIIESSYGRVPRPPQSPVSAGILREAWDFFELFFQYFLEKRINSYAFIRSWMCVI